MAQDKVKQVAIDQSRYFVLTEEGKLFLGSKKARDPRTGNNMSWEEMNLPDVCTPDPVE